MYYRLLKLLNIKKHESALVRRLFIVQFFLGVGTAFLFVTSLSMVVELYGAAILPAKLAIVYLISAVLLLGVNRIYAHIEERMSSTRLLEWIILFSTFSIILLWFLAVYLNTQEVHLFIAAWYLVVYMLVGYSFWGLTAILFNVRESKRVFSIVGAGDIPAKLLGYSAVAVFTKILKPENLSNLYWVSIGAFALAFVVLKRYQRKDIIVAPEAHEHHEHSTGHSAHSSTRLQRFFTNHLIMHIALLSVLAYVVFALIDFTLITGIKKKYSGEQIAVAIAIFMAAGRSLAIPIKLIFSSRVIAKIGLSNALLLTPLLLLLINLTIVISGIGFPMYVYVFGAMALFTEVLRSTVQEPVFFILFQPLKPHDRLRGHLVAKGYTLPFALLGIGLFLYFYLKSNTELDILLTTKLVTAFLCVWIISVYLIKKEYLQTLIASLKKGYFTGSELFLNDKAVIDLLVSKAESNRAIEAVHALNLLERSGYTDIYSVLLKHLHNPQEKVRDYVLSRIVANKMKSALPVIREQLQTSASGPVHGSLLTASYFLEDNTEVETVKKLELLTNTDKKAALTGLLHKDDEATEQLVLNKLEQLATEHLDSRLMALDVIMASPSRKYTSLLKTLLLDTHAVVYKRAMEAAGKVKHYDLFNEVVEVAARHRAYPALQRSILLYGDEIFSEAYWKADTLPAPLIVYLVKAAGKIKGKQSTSFLFKTLTRQPRYADGVIEALWLKKTMINTEQTKLVDNWIPLKVEQSQVKLNYYNKLVTNEHLQLLHQAIQQELQRDLLLLLKGCSLLYERQRIDRVIEILWLGNKKHLYNAIEVLELVIPGKYFVPINVLVELMNDIENKEVLTPASTHVDSSTILTDLLQETSTNFNEWTRSVACYMFPKLTTSERPLTVLENELEENEHLFNETKQYVLSILK